METIIFFYRKRGLTAPLVEAIGQGSYVLVKVGLEAGKDSWFGQAIPEAGEPKTAETMENPRQSVFFKLPLFHGHPFSFRQLREQRAQKERQRQQELLEKHREKLRRQELLQVREQVRGLCGKLCSLVEDIGESACVYGDGLRSCLLGSGEVGRLWREYWSAEEFCAGFELQWVGLLLPEAVCHHFVVLGTAPCIPSVLERCVCRMKSLRWILEADFLESHEEKLEEFAENFYQENGLAVSLEPVSGRNAYGRIRLDCGEPVNVLDFSGGNGTFVGDAAAGSVWLDMSASEEKKRRIEQRNGRIRYVSLKELWRQVQKQCHCLDTGGKNRYNTQKN